MSVNSSQASIDGAHLRPKMFDEEDEITANDEESSMLLTDEPPHYRSSIEDNEDGFLDSDTTSQLICVFVARFDTLKGNVMEWCVPKHADVIGVEFKCICSGWHNLETDYVYFRHQEHIGIAAYNRLLVDDNDERNARMRSVGIITTGDMNTIRQFYPFLASEAARLNLNPGKYDRLMDFYDSSMHGLPRPEVSPLDEALISSTQQIRSFLQFVDYFGPSVFMIWKALMARQRVLFYMPVPVGHGCCRVHWACELVRHSSKFVCSSAPPTPMYYVSIADMPSLSSAQSYVACTSDKIFETKKHLYDVYVSLQHVQPNDEGEVGIGDQRRYSLLKKRVHLQQNTDDSQEAIDTCITRFFFNMNNKILQTLAHTAMSRQKLTTKILNGVDIDSSERTFVQRVCDLYGIDAGFTATCLCCEC